MLVVDIETTGLDPNKHSIVSIGALNFSSPQNQFYGECRIFEGAEITKEALEINGFSEEEVRTKKKSLKELMEEFIAWASSITDKTLAGQNVFFDQKFLENSAKRFNSRPKWLAKHRIIDLHTLAYTLFLKKGASIPLKEGGSELNLNSILKYVGLQARSGPHNALDDAKLEAETFHRFIFGTSLLNEYKSFPVPSHLMNCR